MIISQNPQNTSSSQENSQDLDDQFPEYIEEFDDNFFPLASQSPHILIGGDLPTQTRITPSKPIQISCIVDYLTVTFNSDEAKLKRILSKKKDNGSDEDFIDLLLRGVADIVSHMTWKENAKGMFGYRHSYTIQRDGKNAGQIAFGGNNGSCMISLSGFGTSGVNMAKLRKFYEALPRCKITRIDLAHDDLDGVIPIQQWLQTWHEKGFRISGNNPNCQYIDDNGSNLGKTLYIGSRSGGKQVCIYEKGKQLGDTTSQWVRVEGRWGSAYGNLAFDMMTSPEMYLSGMYPAFESLNVFHETVERIKKHTKIAFKAMIDHCSKSYGKFIGTMADIGYTAEDIVDQLRRPGMPERLILPLIA